MARIIAVLPMKSDSKGIQMKLYKNFNGKPLWQWVFNEVTRCTMIDEVIVSSSDAWMKKYIVCDSRLSFLNRPYELNGDVELLEVMKHAIDRESLFDADDDIIIQVQLNKPLTKTSDLMELIKYFKDNNLDSLTTIQEIKTAVNGKYKSHSRENTNFKSCAIAKLWKRKVLETAKSGTWGYGKKHKDYVIGKHHIEIDDLEDWKIAECLHRGGF